MGCWSHLLKNICQGTKKANPKSHAVQHFRCWIFTPSTQSRLGNGKRKRRVRNILGMISNRAQKTDDWQMWVRERGRGEKGRETGSNRSLVISSWRDFYATNKKVQNMEMILTVLHQKKGANGFQTPRLCFSHAEETRELQRAKSEGNPDGWLLRLLPNYICQHLE